MKIDIRTGQPFTGEPPHNNKIVPIPIKKKRIKESTSQLSAKVREVRALLKKAAPPVRPLKDRQLSVESTEESLPGHINRTAKLLREHH